MKRTVLSGLTAALLAAGCTTYRTIDAFNGINVDGGRRPVETIEISNTAWLLFTFLPIASGNPAKPNRCSSCWFRDTATLENNISVLRARMRERGVHEVANVTSHCEDEKYLAFLLARRAYHTSAVLLKPLPVEHAPQAAPKESVKK